MTSIASAVLAVGSSIKGPGLSSRQSVPSLRTDYTIDQLCDANASALAAPATTKLNQNDPDFAGRTFLCLLAKNTGSPDSVQGAFAIVASISCMIEKAMTAQGIAYDGVAHSITATPDSSCFTATQLTNMGTTGALTISMTPSAPAAFNTYFDRGYKMVVPSFGTYTFAAKVSADVIEFISMEDQSPDATNKTGAYAGYLDKANGVLRYEGRSDRYSGAGTGCSSGSCGWSRHDRVYAEVTADANFKVTGLKAGGKVSAAHSDVSQNTSGPTTSYQGWFASADGNLTTGIKPHTYVTSSATAADLQDPTKYAEQAPNVRCYTSASSNAATCGTGLVKPATVAFPFTLLGTYTSSAAWFNGYAGLTYTTVDPSLEKQ